MEYGNYGYTDAITQGSDGGQGGLAWLKIFRLAIGIRMIRDLFQIYYKPEPALSTLWEADNPRYRARALWLLSKLEERGTHYIEQALADENPDIRITSLRAARQLEVDIIPYVEQFVGDPSAQVRREAAIVLHRNESDRAPELWAQLATRHDGEDRWYLEALGIGAATQWDRFFEAWSEEVGSDWNTPAGRDMVWRSRAEAAVPKPAQIIKVSIHRYGSKTALHTSFSLP